MSELLRVRVVLVLSDEQRVESIEEIDAQDFWASAAAKQARARLGARARGSTVALAEILEREVEPCSD